MKKYFSSILILIISFPVWFPVVVFILAGLLSKFFCEVFFRSFGIVLFAAYWSFNAIFHFDSDIPSFSAFARSAFDGFMD